MELENATPLRILKYKNEQTIGDFIRELSADGYLLKENFEIAMN